ncbi:MAG: hypothetical protein ACTSRY_01420, partial [Alphaproteobacteria bacterium]
MMIAMWRGRKSGRAARLRVPGLFVAAILAVPSVAAAEQLLNTPVYNPETKSYFELHTDQPLEDGKLVGYNRKYSIQWFIARRRARNLFHKGVRGHLAVVKSKSVNEFL